VTGLQRPEESQGISTEPDSKYSWGAGERLFAGRHMPEDAYTRLQARIKDDLGRQSPSAWIGAAFMFLGISASAGLLLLVFPKHPGSIPAGSKFGIGLIAIVALVGFVVSLIAHRSKKHNIRREAEDICEEMDIHAGIPRPEQAVAQPRWHLRWPLKKS
jgi:hypothetical protein